MVQGSLMPIMRVCKLEHLVDEKTANDPAATAKFLRKIMPEVREVFATMSRQEIFDRVS
jgi:hypothetical protein